MFEKIINLLYGALMETNNKTRLIFVDKDRDIPRGTCYGPVIYDHYIFECCIDGGGTVIQAEREISVTVGDGYVLMPGESITLVSDPVHSRTCLWCAVVGTDVGDALAAAGITAENPRIPDTAFTEIRAAISDLYSMRDDTDGGAEYRRTAHIYRILGALLRERAVRNNSTHVNKAIGIMETKYNQPLTVSGIAAAVGLDRAYFTTLFSEQTGSTPYAYLTAIRVRRACTLLATDMPISAVADAVGIPPQNFSRIFRRIVGVTPREYISRK